MFNKVYLAPYGDRCVLLLKMFESSSVLFSGGQAEHRNYRNRSMVNIASGMDHGRVRPTTTTSRNMAAIKPIPSGHAILGYSISAAEPAIAGFHVTSLNFKLQTIDPPAILLS